MPMRMPIVRNEERRLRFRLNRKTTRGTPTTRLVNQIQWQRQWQPIRVTCPDCVHTILHSFIAHSIGFSSSGRPTHARALADRCSDWRRSNCNLQLYYCTQHNRTHVSLKTTDCRRPIERRSCRHHIAALPVASTRYQSTAHSLFQWSLWPLPVSRAVPLGDS